MMREAEIKRALSSHLSLATDSSMLFLEELELYGGKFRADFVDVAEMHCYEIKSSGDTLSRLVGQGNSYCRVFDKVTLVTAECHLKKVIPILPSWWGVLVINETKDKPFKKLRTAKPNNNHEPLYLATLLKKDECISVLEELGAARGWKSKSLYLIQEHVAELLTLAELKTVVRERLKQRLFACVI